MRRIPGQIIKRDFRGRGRFLLPFRALAKAVFRSRGLELLLFVLMTSDSCACAKRISWAYTDTRTGPANEGGEIMIKLGLIGAAALSFVLAAPAMARHVHHGAVVGEVIYPHISRYDRNLPVQDALRLGYSQGREYYPSGWGGLYGDGRYPGNTISNPDYPTWW
jgi:hypothetical protein